MITKELIKEALPVKLKSAATDALAQKINSITQDPEEAKIIRENFVSYGSVLNEGRFQIDDYLSAVAYVSHKMMGCSNQKAYIKTFPQRYQDMVAKGYDDKQISAFVAAYNKNKLVNLVLEQTLIPTWVLNADIYQAAINKQYELMRTAVSEKVQTEAANSLLTHLKRPESKKLEIDLSVAENSGMDELKGMMVALAHQQKEMIASGMSTKEIAHQPLVQSPGSMKDVTPTEEVAEMVDVEEAE